MGVEPVIFQIMLFALSFSVGFVSIVIYTLYSLFVVKIVKTEKIKKFVLCMADILFWMIYAVIVFIVYYNVNNAEFRVFYFIIMLFGLLTAYNIKIYFYKKRNI